ncbi:MAG: GAF domain-containing protein, partial [Acidimicrobiales bacterium]|nr:GAF domain-containing protein [Acidimicrobiales bacterium]
MTDASPIRSGLSAVDVAVLGQKEALQRLELLATASSLLDATIDDYEDAMDSVAEMCVSEFADLCAIEVIAPDGNVRPAAYRHTRTSGLRLPDGWSPIGRLVAPDRRPALVFEGSEGSMSAQQVRDRLGAQSLIAVPISGGGLTLGWFVAATGSHRRGFRPSALRIATDLSGRIAAAIQRVMLHREMQASAREQSRTVRRLRRLAAAATNLAGAATPQAVLDTACMEACVIHEADGAVAVWSKADGSTVTAQAGDVDMDVATSAFESVASGRVSRGRGWIAYPLPNTDPWQHAALVVFVGAEFTGEEEPVLSSLASLIPVAFERAQGTEVALTHQARLRTVVDASPVALVEIDP